MSGDFRPEQQVSIEATDDPALAQHFGLTRFDRATGQYRAPHAPDAGQRDGADVQEQRHADALAEGDEQQRVEEERLQAALAAQAEDAADAQADAAKSKAPTKSTGSKAKADDSK